MPAMRHPSGPRFPLRRLCLQGALLALAASALPAASADVGSERSIKAAFVSKFIGYIEFPGRAAAATAPLVIGVVGADDIAGELARIVGARGINGRAISVRPMAAGDRLAALDVLFIGVGESERAERLLRAAAAEGILTITEFDRALRQGSVINFRIVDQRIRFEVSLAAAEKANLKLSSRLLSVAYYVDKGER
jgi:hypothetical protein